jgi:type II secretory pathway predicted ATPase ExeA
MSAFSMDKEPFPEVGRDEYYFSTPALTARLDELCGAVDRGNVLLLDEQASGKSTMLDSFVETACERWRIFRLQANGHMSAKEFVHELVTTFGLPPREPAAAELRDADTLLELFSTRSVVAVIVIDDVHLLQSSALEQLLYLARRWARYSVRFLICAEPGLVERLESLSEGGHFPGAVTTLGMPRFNHEQVGDYLHMCLFRAGLVGDSPFDPIMVASVTEKARGLVGAIDPLARELLGEAGEQGSHPGRGGPEQRRALRWPVAVVAAAGLGVLLMAALPGLPSPQSKVESRQYLDVFQSSIRFWPRHGAGDPPKRSATADSRAP